jgi:1-acyl-sn-glycerol-3-phosphate acyltransferase
MRLRSNLLQAPVLALATAFFGSMALVASLWDTRGQLQHRIAQLWARVSLWSAWSPLTVMGREHFCTHGPVVYACNHTSYMDTPVLFSTIPGQFRILAKKELWKLPFIGWYLHRSGQIPVDVTSSRAALSSLSGGVRALRDGMSVFVFPEGGRTSDGALQRFENGAAYLAIRAQVPVIPIALSGIRDLLPMHTRHYWPTPLRMIVGAPIQTAGMTVREVDVLTERIRTTIAAMLENAE